MVRMPGCKGLWSRLSSLRDVCTACWSLGNCSSLWTRQQVIFSNSRAASQLSLHYVLGVLIYIKVNWPLKKLVNIEKENLRVRWRCTAISLMLGGLRWEHGNLEASLGKITIKMSTCL